MNERESDGEQPVKTGWVEVDDGLVRAIEQANHREAFYGSRRYAEADIYDAGWNAAKEMAVSMLRQFAMEAPKPAPVSLTPEQREAVEWAIGALGIEARTMRPGVSRELQMRGDALRSLLASDAESGMVTVRRGWVEHQLERLRRTRQQWVDFPALSEHPPTELDAAIAEAEAALSASNPQETP